jgi:Protein of unknown function (DUF3485)
MLRLIASLTACSLALLCGLVHGYWTDRWNEPTDAIDAAARFEQIPLTIGEWDGQPVEVKASQIEAALAGHVQRRYVNRMTGETVTLALVVGRPGPVSIHTPDVCYSASGYVIGPRTRSVVSGCNAEFLTMDAVRTRLTEESRIRLFWAWNAGAGWSAPEEPRLAFARFRVLHKLYVLRDQTNVGEPTREDPCLTFLQVLLPSLDQSLFRQGS